MSELTSCNYCRLKRIKAKAKGRGNKVILESRMGGIDVYVLPKEESLDKERHFVAWLMELTNHCVC